MDRQHAYDDVDGATWNTRTPRGNRSTSAPVVPLRAHGIRELTLSAAEQPAFATSPAGGAHAGAPILLRPAPRRRSDLQWVFEREGATSLRLAADLAASLVAMVVVLLAEGEALTRYPSFLGFPLLVAALMQTRGMYRRRVRVAVLDDVAPVIGAISVATMALLTWTVAVNGDNTAAPYIGRIWLLTVLLLGGMRVLFTLTHRYARS